MTRDEAFALWASKHDMADGLPWETDRKVLLAVFTAGWDAHEEAGKQTMMFASDAITAEAIYAEYPRKESRGTAIKAINRAMKACPPPALLAAVKEYAAVVRTWPMSARFGPDGRSFIPMCASWMNGEKWRDDRTTWKRGANVAQPVRFQNTYE